MLLTNGVQSIRALKRFSVAVCFLKIHSPSIAFPSGSHSSRYGDDECNKFSFFFMYIFCSTDFVDGLIPCIILHLRGQSLSVLQEFQPFENTLHQTTTNKGHLQCDMAVSSHLFFLSLQLNILTEIRARQQQGRRLITAQKLAVFPGSSLQELVLQCILRVFWFQ